MSTTADELLYAIQQYGSNVTIYVQDDDKVWKEAVLETVEEPDVLEDPIALYLHVKRETV